MSCKVASFFIVSILLFPLALTISTGEATLELDGGQRPELSFSHSSLIRNPSGENKINTDLDTVINTNTTWNITNSPYYFSTSVFIMPGTTLNIDPGVMVVFGTETNLTVWGKLNANGTMDAPINFTCGSVPPYIGDWKGLVIQGAQSASSRLEHCNITYANIGLMLWNTNNVTVLNSTFQMNGYGISATDSSAHIYNCSVKQSVSAGIEDTSMTFSNSEVGLTIENCTISDNGLIGIDSRNSDTSIQDTIVRNHTNAGVKAYKSRLRITNSTIYDHLQSTPGVWLDVCQDVLIEKTFIYNNTEGVEAAGSNLTIKNCVISNNYDGVGMTYANTVLIESSHFDNNYWQGIVGIAQSLTIRDCSVANTTTYYGINIINSAPIIENCHLIDNFGGLYLTDCSLTMKDSTITNSQNNGIIIENYNPITTSVHIEDVRSDWNGGSGLLVRGPSTHDTYVVIIGGRFTNNTNGVSLDMVTAHILDVTLRTNYQSGILSIDSILNMTNCSSSFSDQNAGLRALDSQINVIGCTFDSNSVGLDLEDSSGTVFLNRILNSTMRGMIIEGGGTLSVFNNTFTRNSNGISIESASPHIGMNQISRTYVGGHGIYLYDSDARIVGNSVLGYLVGIRIDRGNPIRDSQPYISNNVIANNANGIYLYDLHDPINVFNTTFYNSSDQDIKLYDSTLHVVNTTFSSVNFLGDDSLLTVSWYLDVIVMNHVNVPISSATVSAPPQGEFGGVNVSTGSNGRARLVLPEYRQTQDVTQQLSNHIITVSKTGFQDSSIEITIDQNRIQQFNLLPEVPPRIDIGVSGIWFEPMFPAPDTPFHIHTSIVNSGEVTVHNISVSLYINGSYLFTKPFTELRTNESIGCQFHMGVLDTLPEGEYTVTIVTTITETDSSYKNNTLEKMLYVYDPPIAYLNVSTTLVYPGDLIVFNAGLSTGAFNLTHYLFDFGDQSISGWVSSKLMSHSYNSSGNYSTFVRVIDEHGRMSENSTAIQIQVRPPLVNESHLTPVADFEISPAVGTIMTSYLFSSRSIAQSPIVEYTWNFGDGTEVTTPMKSYEHRFPDDIGYTITLQVKDSQGRTSPEKGRVLYINNTAPIARVDIEQTTVEVGQPLVVSGSGSMDIDDKRSQLRFEWDFGDSTLGLGMNLSHEYERPGNFTVSLTVYDDNDAFNRSFIDVTVLPSKEVAGDVVEGENNTVLMYAIFGIISLCLLILVYLIVISMAYATRRSQREGDEGRPVREIVIRRNKKMIKGERDLFKLEKNIEVPDWGLEDAKILQFDEYAVLDFSTLETHENGKEDITSKDVADIEDWEFTLNDFKPSLDDEDPEGGFHRETSQREFDAEGYMVAEGEGDDYDEDIVTEDLDLDEFELDEDVDEDEDLEFEYEVVPTDEMGDLDSDDDAPPRDGTHKRLTKSEKLTLLQERFVLGDISEKLYLELKRDIESTEDQ